jgi:putative transposase
MRKSAFSESQIVEIVKRAEGGAKLVDLAREVGVSVGTINRWRSKYAGLEASELKRMKDVEEENRRLKRLVADLTLDNQALKDLLGKKW